jgi:hypothetical protein
VIVKVENIKNRNGIRMKKNSWCMLLIMTVLLQCLQYGFAEDREVSAKVPHMNKVVVDGQLDEWKDIFYTKLVTPRWMGRHDLSATTYMGWDDKNLYIAANITDDKIVNNNDVNKSLYLGDQFRLRLSAQPDKQSANFGDTDLELYIAPTSLTGKPACTMKRGKSDTKVIVSGDDSGVKWAVGVKDRGYLVEVAIPVAILKENGFKLGDKVSYNLAIYDKDIDDIAEWKQTHMRICSSSVKKQPWQWPVVELADTVEIPKEDLSKTRANIGGFSASVERKKPSNVFWTGEAVTLPVTFHTPVDGTGKAKVVIKDYFGKSVVSKDITFKAVKKQKDTIDIDFGVLPQGYYTLDVTAYLTTDKGYTDARKRATFGVADKVTRTAKEVRDGGYKFGLKMSHFYNIWWRNYIEWDEREMVEATCDLGLQWTRVLLQDKTEDLPTAEIVTKFPMNAIFKVERFPKELFDTEKYGPLDEWVKINGRAWMLKTLPKEKEYKIWLKKELADIPAEQNVFEIWNEAWDKMNAKDLATLSQWIADAILEVRPDAIIGPNLKGEVSQYEYDAEFIKAGGMNRMKMVALHPYGKSEDRQWMQDYMSWLKEQTGRDIDIYVTEYGTHSCPKGPHKQSEQFQAQKVVRESLGLYSMGVKAFTPHLMGQREENSSYHEHWFGFYRLNSEPKPVLFALATCAKMIDSKRFVGELWYGEGVGAMLFEKNDNYTLALWIKEGAKDITIEPGVAEVTMVDIVGKETKVTVKGGKLAVKVSPDVIYIDGVKDMEKLASLEIREDRWPEPEIVERNKRVAKKFTPSKLDGSFAEWENVNQWPVMNVKVNGNDASGVGYLAWDKDFLYVGLNMRDDQVMNTKPNAKLYSEDSIELFVSSEVRDTDLGYGPHDHQFFITPASKLGGPKVLEVLDGTAGVTAPIKGSKSYIGKSKKGWVAQVAIPWSTFPGFEAKTGASVALEMRVNDADTSHKRWKLDLDGVYISPTAPTEWSILELK